jgi:hypothetical protein
MLVRSHYNVGSGAYLVHCVDEGIQVITRYGNMQYHTIISLDLTVWKRDRMETRP